MKQPYFDHNKEQFGVLNEICGKQIEKVTRFWDARIYFTDGTSIAIGGGNSDDLIIETYDSDEQETP